MCSHWRGQELPPQAVDCRKDTPVDEIEFQRINVRNGRTKNNSSFFFYVFDVIFIKVVEQLDTLLEPDLLSPSHNYTSLDTYFEAIFFFTRNCSNDTFEMYIRTDI